MSKLKRVGIGLLRAELIEIANMVVSNYYCRRFGVTVFWTTVYEEHIG